MASWIIVFSNNYNVFAIMKTVLMFVMKWILSIVPYF